MFKRRECALNAHSLWPQSRSSCLNNIGGSSASLLVYGRKWFIGEEESFQSVLASAASNSSPIISLNYQSPFGNFIARWLIHPALPQALWTPTTFISQTSKVHFSLPFRHMLESIRRLQIWLRPSNAVAYNSPVFPSCGPLSFHLLSSLLMALSNGKHMMLSLNPRPDIPHSDHGRRQQGERGEMHICGAALIIAIYWRRRGKRQKERMCSGAERSSDPLPSAW